MGNFNWNRIVEAYENNETIEGYVISHIKGGLSIDIFGNDAFLPGSQILMKPTYNYEAYVGKTLTLKIININPKTHNIIVSHKSVIEETWKKLNEGDIVEGNVVNITNYGAFVSIDDAVGLIYLADLSWATVSDPNTILSIGDKVKVVVLDIDKKEHKMSLGYKQFLPNPWDSMPEMIKVGKTIKGKITNILDYGIFVEIIPGVNALVHETEFLWNQVVDVRQLGLQKGDEVEGVIIYMDKSQRKLSLSIKCLTPRPKPTIVERLYKWTKHLFKLLKKSLTKHHTNNKDEAKIQFSQYHNMKDVIIPELISKITNEAFSGNTTLCSITLPNTIKKIGYKAFSSCTSLTSIIIPEGCETLGLNIFEGCTSLQSATIPSTITEVDCETFSGCESLTDITLPATLTSIGFKAFYGCSSLHEITIPEGVTRIAKAAFGGCTSLQHLIIPESVTHIASTAFEGCTALKSVTLPSNIKPCHSDLFMDCKALVAIYVPAGRTDFYKERLNKAQHHLIVEMSSSIAA